MSHKPRDFHTARRASGGGLQKLAALALVGALLVADRTGAGDLPEIQARGPGTFKCLLHVLGNEKGSWVAPGAEHLGIAHLGRVDAHAVHSPILPKLVGAIILWLPVRDLGTGGVVDASYQARDIDEEVGLRA